MATDQFANQIPTYEYNPSNGFKRVEPADPLETALAHISELNTKIHQLRGDRDKWKAAAQVRAKRINELLEKGQ